MKKQIWNVCFVFSFFRDDFLCEHGPRPSQGMYSGGRSPSSYDNEEPALMYIRFDKKGYKIMPPPATNM